LQQLIGPNSFRRQTAITKQAGELLVETTQVLTAECSPCAE